MCTRTLSRMQGNTQPTGLFGEDELAALAPHAQPVAYPMGTTLVREGDPSDFVLFLRSGHLKVVAGKPRGIVRIYAPGEVAGQFAIMTRRPRTADLIALNPVEALLIPGEFWLEFLLNDRRANLAMFNYLASMVVAKDHQQLESMTSSEYKIARGILKLIDAGMGEATESGLLIEGMPQRDLGSLSGLSRESAAGVLKRLREAKVLSTGRGSLVIHDKDAIEQMASRNAQPPLNG